MATFLQDPEATATVASFYGKRESQSAERVPPAKRPRREERGEGHESGDGPEGGVSEPQESLGAATER